MLSRHDAHARHNGAVCAGTPGGESAPPVAQQFRRCRCPPLRRSGSAPMLPAARDTVTAESGGRLMAVV